MKYARIIENMVHEVVVPPDGMSIKQMFHPDIVGMFTQVPDHIAVRWTVDAQGVWIPPLVSEEDKE